MVGHLDVLIQLWHHLKHRLIPTCRVKSASLVTSLTNFAVTWLGESLRLDVRFHDLLLLFGSTLVWVDASGCRRHHWVLIVVLGDPWRWCSCFCFGRDITWDLRLWRLMFVFRVPSVICLLLWNFLASNYNRLHVFYHLVALSWAFDFPQWVHCVVRSNWLPGWAQRCSECLYGCEPALRLFSLGLYLTYWWHFHIALRTSL